MVKNYYVVTPDGVFAWCARYRPAVRLFKRAVRRWPERNIGLFQFGSDSSLWWHFGSGAGR